MAAELIIDPDADADVDVGRIYDWYEGQRIGLGEEFLSCVEACVAAVRRMPKAGRVVQGAYRRALVRRFPCAVYYDYAAETNTVTVFVVMHTAQDPEEWQARLP